MEKENSGRVLVLSCDVSVLDDDVVFDRLFASASPARREKTQALRFRPDKNLSLGAEYLLAEACREFGLDLASLTAQAGPGEKPGFPGSGVSYNLSHSGTRAICVMSAYECGCDIEQIDKADLRVASRYFAPEECAQLDSCRSEEEKRELFYRLWTLKESYMKCTGLGFRLALGAFAVSAEKGAPRLLRGADEAEYSFFEPEPPAGYRCSVCVRAPAGEFFTDVRKIVIP